VRALSQQGAAVLPRLAAINNPRKIYASVSSRSAIYHNLRLTLPAHSSFNDAVRRAVRRAWWYVHADSTCSRPLFWWSLVAVIEERGGALWGGSASDFVSV
jgi:hypothetical protein